MPSSRGSSWPRDQTRISGISGRFFTHWATWEANLKSGWMWIVTVTMVTGDSGELGLCKIWLTVLRGLDSVQYNLKKSHGLVRNTFYTELHLEMGTLITKLKSRGITLPTKVRLVKAMVFPVVMYGCESWTIKKVKNWCFWTVVL